MIPLVPNGFRSKAVLDVDAVNQNLLRIARDIADVQSLAYTRCPAVLDLTGITNASAQALRELAIRCPAPSDFIEVNSVELVLYTDAAVTATVTCSDPSFPAFSVLTSATPTVENTASSGNAVAIPSSAADVTFTVSFSGAVNVVAGYLIAHVRSNRAHARATVTPYVPALLDASDPITSARLQAEIDAIAAAVASDAGAQNDLRCQIVSARNLAAGASAVFRVPAGPGAAGDFTVDVYVVCANTNTGRCTVQDTGAAVNTDVVGTGAGARAHGSHALNQAGGIDPMDPTKDIIVTLKNQAGAATVLLIYAVVWWL